MTEILLNAILNLFALQASALSPAERPSVRESLERYLRGHLRLWNVSNYAALFEVALDLQELIDFDDKAARTVDIACQLGAELTLLEQYVLLLYYLEPVARLKADAPARRLADTASASLSTDPRRVEALRLLCLSPFPRRLRPFHQPGCRPVAAWQAAAFHPWRHPHRLPQQPALFRRGGRGSETHGPR